MSTPHFLEGLDARGWMSLLFHGAKAVEVLEVALELGLLAALDDAKLRDEWVTVGELASTRSLVPARLFKLCDALEALALVDRLDPALGDALVDTRFRSRVPLESAARSVVSATSLERDRDAQPWRSLHGRLGEVLRGAAGIPEDEFAWPPATQTQAERFARSMDAGLPPIVESLLARRRELVGDGPRRVRVLDVGGGSGALARALAEADERIAVDVVDLPELRAMTEASFAASRASARLRFLARDVFAEPLPGGYDLVLFVRILHDWPAERARALLRRGSVSLAPDGRVVVCEEMRTPARAALQFFWSYFLVGVDACQSRLREASSYVRWLEEDGMRAEVLDGPFDLVVGRSRSSD